MTRLGRALLGAAAAAALAAGCGSAGGIGSDASARLAPRVAEVRSAAARGDLGAAERHLADLRTEVADMVDDGAISRGRAAAILGAAAEVESELRRAGSTSTTAAPPPPPPPTTAAPAARSGGSGGGGGSSDDGDDDGGKGKGKRGKDGDD